MSKNNSPDFFGMKKSPKYFSGKSNLNFLSSKKNNSKPNKNKKVKPVNFLNGTSNGQKKKHMDWNYKKIKNKFPGINPWGDADLDGTPNKYDCKPFDASKDQEGLEGIGGLSGFKKIASIFGRKKKQFRVETGEERILRETAGRIKQERRKSRKVKLKEFAETGGRLREFQRRLVKKIPSKKQFAKTRKGIQRAIALAGIPVKVEGKTKSRKGESVRAHAGRPKGSFKFTIPGRGPVPIHVYKKWIAEQKAKARIVALAQVKAIQAGQQAPLDGEEEFEEVPSEEIPLEEFEEVPTARPTPPPTQLTPEQIRQTQQIRQQQIQQAPPQPVQQQGVPRENLDFSTSSILTPQGNILNAPNINKGELKGVGEVPSVKLGERPQTNPRGELYTNIDPVTGNAIVQRRISAKFLTHGDRDR